MDGMTLTRQYRGYLFKVAPDLTDADILRLKDFVPKPTPIALAVWFAFGAFRG